MDLIHINMNVEERSLFVIIIVFGWLAEKFEGLASKQANGSKKHNTKMVLSLRNCIMLQR